jgi:hypothetical protein
MVVHVSKNGIMDDKLGKLLFAMDFIFGEYPPRQL